MPRVLRNQVSLATRIRGGRCFPVKCCLRLHWTGDARNVKKPWEWAANDAITWRNLIFVEDILTLPKLGYMIKADCQLSSFPSGHSLNFVLVSREAADRFKHVHFSTVTARLMSSDCACHRNKVLPNRSLSDEYLISFRLEYRNYYFTVKIWMFGVPITKF